LQDIGIGLKIGNINVNNTGCADDIALLSTQLSDVQIMVNMALDFANLEGYELQPKKSVAIHIRGNDKQCETTNSVKQQTRNLIWGISPCPRWSKLLI
jgi:hypothetical protein